MVNLIRRPWTTRPKSLVSGKGLFRTMYQKPAPVYWRTGAGLRLAILNVSFHGAMWSCSVPTA